MNKFQLINHNSSLLHLSFVEAQRDFKQKKRQFDALKRDLLFAKQELIASTKKLHSSQTLLRKTTSKRDELLHSNEKNMRVQLYKQREKDKKKADKAIGKNLNLAAIARLPDDVVQLIYQFIPFETRIQYLVDTYKPFHTLKCIHRYTKGNFFEAATNYDRYFYHIPFNERQPIRDDLMQPSQIEMDRSIYLIFYDLKLLNPQGAYNLIQTICILFKPDKKYDTNIRKWLTHRQQLRLLQETFQRQFAV